MMCMVKKSLMILNKKNLRNKILELIKNWKLKKVLNWKKIKLMMWSWKKSLIGEVEMLLMKLKIRVNVDNVGNYMWMEM